MSAGQASIGASLSSTTTLNMQASLVLPLASVAVQLTELVPLAKLAPLVGAQLTVWPGQLSAPRSEERRAGKEHGPGGALLVMLDGQASVGASVSSTITLNMQASLVLPLASVAVQLTELV